jgi:hypothetical protein
MLNFTRLFSAAALAALTAVTLVACGGSDSAPIASATISGTAATGAAIAGGTVTFKCVAGAVASTTTAADGSFSVDVSGATLPCVARVAYTDGTGAAQKLHTVVLAAGIANITPLTELLLANLTGGKAADAFDNFDAAKARGLTSAQVTAAVASIKAYLVTLGVSVTNFPSDPIGAKFAAKTGTTAGDSSDALLDALAAKLISIGKTLGDAVSDVAKTGGSTTSGMGFPASATYAGKLSDGTACSVVINGSAMSVNATTWAYGNPINTVLGNSYFDSTNSQVSANGGTYIGTNRFWEGVGGASYGQGTSAKPEFFTQLYLDSTSGKLIYALAAANTDSSAFPAAGTNFSGLCYGDAFPTDGTKLASSYNVAAVSAFKATSLVGTWTAPSDAAGTACTFAVDGIGNTTITSANFTGGKLVARYTDIDTGTSAINDANNATYTLSGADTYAIKLDNTNNVKRAQVVINGYPAGTMVNGMIPKSKTGEQSITCSTANDPNAKWTSLAGAIKGSYTGVVDSNFNFTSVGSKATCSLSVAADGTTVYTDSKGVPLTLSPANTTAPMQSMGKFFDFMNGNFSIDFNNSTAKTQGQQTYGNNVFYTKGGGSTEYCLQLK